MENTDTFTGQLLEGKYQVLERVGHGGMGVVYRAKHTLMDREVALKILHTHLAESPEFLKRFKHEAQVASKLRHPNAVMIYDFGIADRQPYLVMEFVKGDTLKDLLAKRGALEPKELLSIMSQVFSALEEAHRLGIVHRDLKPDNFILTEQEDGRYKAQVLDFGIAKVVHGQDSTVMTQAGSFFGTPRYASPEQALGKELDARADIYALGVILYEGLTGEIPFDAPSMMELLLKHLNQPPPPVRSKKPELSIEIEKVVLKALEKDKDKRYQSVAELHSAFQEAVENSVATIKSGSARPLLFVGSFIILVFGLGIFLLSGGTGEKEEVVVAAKESPTPGLTPVPTPTELPTDVPTSPPATPELVSPPVVVTLYVPPSALPSIAEPVSPEPTSEIVPEPPQSVAPPEAEPTQTTEPTPTPLPVVPTPFMRQESESRAVAAIDVEKLDSVAAYRKAEQLYRAKRYAEAVPYYEFTIKKDPNFKKARLSLGICYQRISRMQDALNQFKLALKLDPTYPPTLFDLACWYSVSGNTEEALRWLEKAIQYEPAVRRWAASERDLSPLKNHPRYKVLLQR